jgi:hypothetical protein
VVLDIEAVAAEQIIGPLRQAQVELAYGRTVRDICRGFGFRR